MATYISFPVEAHSQVLVEIAEPSAGSSGGVIKAGFSMTKAGDLVASAQGPLQDALSAAISESSAALVNAAKSIGSKVGELEVEFGLKVTGEFGNVVIGKLGGEVNFIVRIRSRGAEAEHHD